MTFFCIFSYVFLLESVLAASRVRFSIQGLAFENQMDCFDIANSKIKRIAGFNP